MELNPSEFVYLGLCIESLLYGLYSGIFFMYLQYQASKKDSETDNPIIFYALCVLYILCVAMISADIAAFVIRDNRIIYRISIIQAILFGCDDFVSQCILIYRCWIVWGCNTHVVIIPSILAIGFLATWIGGMSVVPEFVVQGRFVVSGLGNTLSVISLAMSMTVNALVMCLIVFRIFKVFREVNVTTTLDAKYLGVTGGRKLWSIMFVIIESGMALFSIQLARVVVSTSLGTTANSDFNAFGLIVGMHEMLNGITPTIILVRVSMGLSFHDEASMVEVAGSLLRFTPDDPNSIPETGTSGSISHWQKRRDDSDASGIGGSDDDDIQMAER